MIRKIRQHLSNGDIIKAFALINAGLKKNFCFSSEENRKLYNALIELKDECSKKLVSFLQNGISISIPHHGNTDNNSPAFRAITSTIKVGCSFNSGNSNKSENKIYQMSSRISSEVINQQKKSEADYNINIKCAYDENISEDDRSSTYISTNGMIMKNQHKIYH